MEVGRNKAIGRLQLAFSIGKNLASAHLNIAHFKLVEAFGVSHLEVQGHRSLGWELPHVH